MGRLPAMVVSIAVGIASGFLIAFAIRQRAPQPIPAVALAASIPNREPVLRVLVPAYFYPVGPGLVEWNRLIDAAQRVPITAVINVHDGPGDVVDPAYRSILDQALARGVVPIGYVHTKYGERPIEEVLKEIAQWAQLYPGLRGIFLDSQSTAAASRDYYNRLRDAARPMFKDAVLVGNPGTLPPEGFFAERNTDATCVYESHEEFLKFRVPPWSAPGITKQFAVLPYGVGTPEVMKDFVARAARDRIGWIYVTDASGANPWIRLPVYWEDEVKMIHEING